jgi:thymidylate synthase ThyX
MKIKIVDELKPEDVAMLQALYSRSAESVDTHLEKVKQVGSARFMEQNYLNYGHKSIADCGSTTIFVEGVSLLAAKAIQDWPLYSGQETSTRYIDMSKQGIVDPIGSPASSEILEHWMTFYTSNQERVAGIIRRRHPKGADEKQETYDRAVKARTFDVMRAWLPAGIKTQLSWHTNLRQAGDHLTWMLAHPLPEVAEIALEISRALANRYKSSTGEPLAAVSGVSNRDPEAAEARWKWIQAVAEVYTYPTDYIASDDSVRVTYTADLFATRELEYRYREVLATRPRGCVLPHFMSDLGLIAIRCLLDFGSFRDWQRHRNGVVRMPLLDMSYGFHPWYLKQLGEDDNDQGELRDAAAELLKQQVVRTSELPPSAEIRQYYQPLGQRVPCQVTMGLPAMIYFLELRSSKMVHPTLRQVVQTLVKGFRETFPYVALHADEDRDDWDIRRGDQTILRKT